MSWITESNRMKHFLYAIPCGLFGMLFVLGLAVGMEFKDKIYGGKFDILDILATLLGGSIGFTAMIIISLCTGAMEWYAELLLKLTILI